jgi:cyclopropane fatty-acyl-phospholipid synthase-like methyltransferase
MGIDYSPRAIEMAMRKGEVCGSKARFQVMDALEVMSLDRRFDTIIDSTLLPNIAKRDRRDYLDAVRGVLSSNGTFLLLIFHSERSSRTPPYRMTKEETMALLAPDWRINYIREGTIELDRPPRRLPAWVVSTSPNKA